MAGTTADKLELLENTKEALKAALYEKGQTPGDVFSDYPDMVRAIQSGGGALETCACAITPSEQAWALFTGLSDDGTPAVRGQMLNAGTNNYIYPVRGTALFIDIGYGNIVMTSSYNGIDYIGNGGHGNDLRMCFVPLDAETASITISID